MMEKSLFAGFGGAEASTRTGERVIANYIDTACPPIKFLTKNKATGGRK